VVLNNRVSTRLVATTRKFYLIEFDRGFGIYTHPYFANSSSMCVHITRTTQKFCFTCELFNVWLLVKRIAMKLFSVYIRKKAFSVRLNLPFLIYLIYIYICIHVYTYIPHPVLSVSCSKQLISFYYNYYNFKNSCFLEKGLLIILFVLFLLYTTVKKNNLYFFLLLSLSLNRCF
jgi:hypothetical protein